MIFTFWVLLVILTLWFTHKWMQAKKYADLPGPAWYLSLPLIGHAYMLGSNPCTKMLELREKYGDIFRLDVGSFPSIFLISKSLLNQAFRKDEFNGRIWNEMPALGIDVPHDNVTGNRVAHS